MLALAVIILLMECVLLAGVVLQVREQRSSRREVMALLRALQEKNNRPVLVEPRRVV